MTQIIVTLDDNSQTPNIRKAIEMIKGVVKTSLFKDTSDVELSQPEQETISHKINYLRGIANIQPEQIEEQRDYQ